MGSTCKVRTAVQSDWLWGWVEGLVRRRALCFYNIFLPFLLPCYCCFPTLSNQSINIFANEVDVHVFT